MKGKCKETKMTLDKHETSLYLSRISQVIIVIDVQKLQQDIQINPTIKDQMANLSCLLNCIFMFFVSVLVAMYMHSRTKTLGLIKC